MDDIFAISVAKISLQKKNIFGVIFAYFCNF